MKKRLMICLVTVCLLITALAPAHSTLADEVIEATAEPTAAPTAEPTEIPATEAPATAAPATEAPATPSPETVPPATEAPSPEPTATAPAEKLSVSAKVSAAYAFANEDTISAKVAISGGTAPYSMALTVNGSKEQSWSGIAEAGSRTVSYAPGRYGVHKFEITVSDAAGASRSCNFEVPVAVRQIETESEWKKSFSGVELTGDWRADLIAIAETQVGYKENRRNFIIGSEGTKQCYTRYGHWYGSSYADWCAMFVSFCLNYAEIPENDFPHEANCAKWKKLLQGMGAYVDDERGYEPRPGDLVFINRQSEYGSRKKLENKPLHVGVVEKVADGMVHTIEGNNDAAVRRQEYERDSIYIVGYCSTERLMDRVGMLPIEEIEWTAVGAKAYTGNANINLRSDATVSSDVVAKVEEAGSPMTVLGAKMTGSMLWYQVQYDGFTGYVRGDLVEIQEALTPAETDAAAEPWNDRK